MLAIIALIVPMFTLAYCGTETMSPTQCRKELVQLEDDLKRLQEANPDLANHYTGARVIIQEIIQSLAMENIDYEKIANHSMGLRAAYLDFFPDSYSADWMNRYKAVSVSLGRYYLEYIGAI